MLIQLTQAHLADVLPLYRSALGLPGCTWCEEYPSPELLAEDIRTGCLFGWVEGGCILAAAAIEPEDEADVISLARVVTDAAHHSRGIARRMLTALLAALRLRGCRKARLLVSPENAAALRLYAGLGFTAVGECDCYDHHWLAEELPLE